MTRLLIIVAEVGVLFGVLLIILFQTDSCDCHFWSPVIEKAVQWRKQWIIIPGNSIKYDDNKKRLLKWKYYKLSSLCSTSTVTTTSTSTISTDTFCATVNNIRGACRRRKKFTNFPLLHDELMDNQLIEPTKMTRYLQKF